MASIIDRIRNYLRSPRGRQMTDRGRQMARDPRYQQRLKGLFARRKRR